MTLKYITKDGDTLDYIVWKQYGKTNNGIVERVLSANTGLADFGAVLPLGLTVILPEIKQEQNSAPAKVKLWD